MMSGDKLELTVGQSGLVKLGSFLFLAAFGLSTAVFLLGENYFMAAVGFGAAICIVLAIREAFTEWHLVASGLEIRSPIGRRHVDLADVSEIRLDEAPGRLYVTLESGFSTSMPEKTRGLWDFTTELIRQVQKLRSVTIVGPIELTEDPP